MRVGRKPILIEAIERRLLLSVTRPAHNTGTGFFVKDGLIYDANGNEFIMKGPNTIHAWGSYNTNYTAIDQIAKTGANAARAVMYKSILGTSNGWNDAADTPARRKAVVERYLANGMVVIPEDHAGIQDSSAQSNPAALDEITTNWIANGAWLKQYEAGVILNIANEWGPVANASGSNTVWRDSYITQVNRLRRGADNTLGTADDITNLIMIDAGGWGQDFNTLRLHAQQVLDADPQKNIVFSIHLYGSWRDESRSFEVNGTANSDYGPWDIKSRLQSLTTRPQRLPLVIGEFAWEDFRDFSNSGAPFAGYRTQRLLQIADELGIGWLGWSYNGSSPSTLNMVSGSLNNINYNTSTDLSDWGDLLTNDPTYGFKASARRATVFPFTGLPAAPAGLPAMPSAPPAANKILVEKTLLNVPETGAAVMNVRLSQAPASNVTITASRSSGDTSLTVRSSTLVFTPLNWNVPQALFIDAASDADASNSTAKIQLQASGFQTVDFVAREIEANLPTGTLALNPVADRKYDSAGTASTVSVTSTTSPQPTGAFFMRFNLASIGGKVTDAKLRIFKSTVTSNLLVRVHHALTDSWTESSTTGINASYPVAAVTAPNAAGYFEISLTSIVRAEAFKDGTITLAISTGSGSITVDTREGTNPPQLVVTSAEAVPPLLLASDFRFDLNPNQLTFRFDEDVSTTISAANVLVEPLAGGLPLSLAAPNFDPVTETASFAFVPAIVPDGRYRATLIPQGIADASGNALLTGTSFEFFSLAGDANRDGTVDFGDMLILAQNYGTTATYTQGDLNRNNIVDFNDLLILAQSYGSSLVLGSPAKPSPSRQRRVSVLFEA